MESIYEPENVHATEPIDAKAYFEEFSKICPVKCCEIEADRLNLIKDEMALDDLSLEDIASLEELCSIDKLNLADEITSLPMPIPEKLFTKTEMEIVQPITDSARTLETVKCKERNEEKARLDVNLGTKKIIRLGEIIKNDSADNICLNKRDKLAPGSTFIYSINVYKPFVLNYVQRNASENLRFAFEIEALGTNTLAEIADKIRCMSDEAIIKEVENTSEDLTQFLNARVKYPSRFFFIGDAFYNDFQHPRAIDLSYTVRKWLKEKNISDCKAEDMSLTVLETIHPRLGYPYVYVHQGNCEHVISFSDARMLQSTDCLNVRKYPRISFTKRDTNIGCFMCSTLHATWMIFNSDRLPLKKVFMCTECTNSYMYLNGEKIGNFQLFPYFDGNLKEPLS